MLPVSAIYLCPDSAESLYLTYLCYVTTDIDQIELIQHTSTVFDSSVWSYKHSTWMLHVLHVPFLSNGWYSLAKVFPSRFLAVKARCGVSMNLPVLPHIYLVQWCCKGRGSQPYFNSVTTDLNMQCIMHYSCQMDWCHSVEVHT